MPPKKRGRKGAASKRNQVKKDPLIVEKKKQLKIFLAEFDIELENRIQSIKNDLIIACRNIQTFYDMQLLTIPAQFHDLTTEQFREMKEQYDCNLKENAISGASKIVDITSVLSRIESCRVASAKKKGRMKKRITGLKPQKRLTRVSEDMNTTGFRTARRALAQMQETVTPISKKQGLPINITPAKRALHATPSVTPKFDPRKPLCSSVLRTAKAGEIVMSLSGSPLLNTANVENKPGVLLSLGGGKVLNITDISSLSGLNIDHSTKRTLKLVNDRLGKILSSTSSS